MTKRQRRRKNLNPEQRWKERVRDRDRRKLRSRKHFCARCQRGSTQHARLTIHHDWSQIQRGKPRREHTLILCTDCHNGEDGSCLS